MQDSTPEFCNLKSPSSSRPDHRVISSPRLSVLSRILLTNVFAFFNREQIGIGEVNDHTEPW